MVDVGAKPVTERRAIAQAVVRMQPDTLARIDQAPKGAVLATAKLAAIQAAKRTADLIPLCHPLRLTSVDVQAHLDVEQGQVTLLVTVAAWERTGVEMEALTAASIGALTVYDMLKSVDRQITITDVLLLGKEGGSSSPPASP
jgi:cyclic pyranopterin phosphate synthase